MKCFIEKKLDQKGLYDTGADITCMSANLFRRIPIAQRPRKLLSRNSRISAASNDDLTPLGTYEMSLKLEGRSFKHPVIVMSKLNEEFILGMDFIEKNNLYYDMKTKLYHWDQPV